MKFTGALIRRIREQELHLTQDEFARRLGKAKSTVQNWERGSNSPRADMKARIIELVHPERRAKLGLPVGGQGLDREKEDLWSQMEKVKERLAEMESRLGTIEKKVRVAS
jgi:transcriptional regulator with XRE-family HTH domain